MSEFTENFWEKLRSNEVLGGIIATILAGVIGYLVGTAAGGDVVDPESSAAPAPTVTVTVTTPVTPSPGLDDPPADPGEQVVAWLKDLERGDSGGNSRARDVRTDPVEIDGQVFENSVEMRCGDSKSALPGNTCWQEFILSRDYSEFSATVGLANDTPEGTRVRIIFSLDGRQLDAQTIQSLGRDQGFPVQFSLVQDGMKANRIRIEVQFIEGEGYAAFGNPQVTS